MPSHINCNDIVDFTFQAGKWFIIAALVAALFLALAESISRLKAARAAEGTKGFVPKDLGELIGALKDLLVALGNLPAWFAIFLAGGVLIWFASYSLKVCH
jgi:hypothetical protein